MISTQETTFTGTQSERRAPKHHLSPDEKALFGLILGGGGVVVAAMAAAILGRPVVGLGSLFLLVIAGSIYARVSQVLGG
ncbi:hypothetical protein GALL_152330 [mine drainage metagenome]|uniref:Uncharacterized protein n=1 Tax=mine drainage metagenome TaxID=410659 RepID=A0A1J5S467_9ZZZZ